MDDTGEDDMEPANQSKPTPDIEMKEKSFGNPADNLSRPEKTDGWGMPMTDEALTILGANKPYGQH